MNPSKTPKPLLPWAKPREQKVPPTYLYDDRVRYVDPLQEEPRDHPAQVPQGGAGLGLRDLGGTSTNNRTTKQPTTQPTTKQPARVSHGPRSQAPLPD